MDLRRDSNSRRARRRGDGVGVSDGSMMNSMERGSVLSIVECSSAEGVLAEGEATLMSIDEERVLGRSSGSLKWFPTPSALIIISLMISWLRRELFSSEAADKTDEATRGCTDGRKAVDGDRNIAAAMNREDAIVGCNSDEADMKL